MITTNAARNAAAASLRRRTTALLVGAAMITSAPAWAAPVVDGVAVPAQDEAPAVGAKDFDKPTAVKAATDSTGAIGKPEATAQTGAAVATDNPDQETHFPDAAAPVAPAPATPAPAPTVAQPAAPIVDPLNAEIVALLAEQGPTARVKMTAADRAALSAFYAARQGAPLWLSNGKLSDKAEAARTRISHAADDALDARRYKLPAQPTATEPAALAKTEIEFTLGALAYAREAWGGRVAPDFVSPNIALKADPFDVAAALGSLDTSSDVASTLDGFNPPHPQFHELRKELKIARGETPEAKEPEKPVIAAGKLAKPGDDDPRVPALRKRLGLSGADDDFYYDAVLADAVIDFQKKAKIGANGLINKQTVRALNGVAIAGSGKPDASLIELNMERWRWLPRDLGAKHVFVDLPAFRLHIYEGGRTTYDTRVIIGKPSNQTPLLSSSIYNIVVNPYWNVPVSIAMNEMQNGSLRGFEVVDSRGKKVEYVDWEAIRAGRMRIRQAPGERNALGHIKFQFLNKFAVYLHDTSSRSLFAKDYRAMSHGCVRVDQPFEFADALTGDQGIAGDKLKSMIGGKERGLPVGNQIPVHLTYFTAWVDPNGKIERRPDLYDIDQRLNLALKGEPLPALQKSTPIAQVKPRPVKKPEQMAQPEPQYVRQRDPGPFGWLGRIFGDSRY